MKYFNRVGVALLIFTLVGCGFGKAQGTGDSIVQITAEVQGLQQVTPDSLPPFGTYWLAMPNASFAPLPTPPWDQTLPVYGIASGQYLVDDTGGQLSRGNTITAMEVESNAVVNLINQIQTTTAVQSMGMAAAMDSSLPLPGTGSGGDGSGYTNDYILGYSFDTNLLWLQITNVVNGTAYANLYNATNQVYAIWATTNLALPLTNWQVETEVFPSSSTTNCFPFTVATLGRQDLFLRAQDWTGVDSNGDGVPDWWMWYYFHTLDLNAADYDSQGIDTIGDDYTNRTDPNVISFTIAVPNTYVNTAYPTLFLNINSGMPGYVAILTNDSNLADAEWEPYTNSSVVVALGADRDYNVSVGLRGFPTNATETWQSIILTKNTIAPLLTIVSPTGNTTSQTPIQFQGFAGTALNTLTFDFSNAYGTFTNEPGYLAGQFYDTNAQAFTTDYFESGDIDLASGPNTITLHATDWAGNETNVSFTVNYSPSTNTPILAIVWPPAGAAIGGSNFTLQAQVDNPAASISATVGGTTIQGVIERNGTAWVQNLPLTPGTNDIVVTVNDSNGSTSTNLSVVDNDVGLVIFPLTEDQLNQSSVNVSGEIGDPSLSVYVNGVKANVDDDGIWEADDVPVNSSGTATINVQVNNGDSVLAASQTLNQAQPVMVAMMSYSGHKYYRDFFPWDSPYSQVINWFYNTGGNCTASSGYSYDFTPETNGVSYIAGVTDRSGHPFPFGMPWEYASLSINTSYYYPYENYTQTRVMIKPTGQIPTGTANIYLVFANASEFSDDWITYLDGNSEYSIRYDGMFMNYGSLTYAGNVPLPPEWLQIRGQTLLNSGITNRDGSVSGFTLVSAPAGENVDVTPVATKVYQNWDYTFNVQVFKSKEAWQQDVRDEIYADTHSAADMNTYNPANGFMYNRTNLQAVYAFYQKLFTENPNLLWAGLGKLAGAPVYAGLSDTEHTKANSILMLPFTLLGLTTNDLTAFQNTLITMNTNILQDLAWQSEAYYKGGLQGLNVIYAGETNALDLPTINAWREIDDGISKNIASEIQDGNLQLAHREQFTILQPIYNTLNGAVTNLMSALAQNPVPTGTNFMTVVPSGSLSVFADRWNWITNSAGGIWPAWVAASPTTQSGWVNIQLTTRAANYALYSIY